VRKGYKNVVLRVKLRTLEVVGVSGTPSYGVPLTSAWILRVEWAWLDCMCLHHEFNDSISFSWHFHSKNSQQISGILWRFWKWLNHGDFVISLSGCVAELGVGGVERRALARAFQRTKEYWISSSGSKVMIVWSCRCALGFFIRVRQFLVMVFQRRQFLR
jgi:hypothetical protein